MSETQCALLHTRSGIQAIRLHTARGFVQRLRGWIGHHWPATVCPVGLLIPDCRSVHTSFMNCPLDIIYLADWPDQGRERFRVTQARRLSRWRWSCGRDWTEKSEQGARVWITRHVLELPAGSIQAWSIRPGDTLILS